MDKDATLRELNEINKQLAKQLDESRAHSQKLEDKANELANDIRSMCTTDIISSGNYISSSEHHNKGLVFSKLFGNANP